MTKSQAMEFRRKWKTPPRVISTPTKKGEGDASSRADIMNSPVATIALRLQDTEKGLERVGRYGYIQFQSFNNLVSFRGKSFLDSVNNLEDNL